MFDYRKYFDMYCEENGIELRLSFDMPPNYENANGMFDGAAKTVFINAARLAEASEHEKAFFLFHELRHASQQLCPEQFGSDINSSSKYVIMYDGTCYKLVGGEYLECKIDGDEEYFTDLYLGQPYEADANAFAYEQASKICGDSDELRSLYKFFMPRRPVPDGTYESIFAMIDEKTMEREKKAECGE
ncbi:MAG: hypothetical protein IKI49_01005 [Oscillospiraceae bacterium]|nr:hypothetical protein [Oscillospiraceae bacterium]